MDYQRIYEQLIQSARDNPPVGCKERHHIVPVCLGGPNTKDNLIDFTPEQHFLAHQLLLKIYPNNPGILAAAVLMSGRKSYRGNKRYGWIRRKISVARTGIKMTLETRAKMSESAKIRASRGVSEETRKRQSDSMKGRKFGPLSESTKAKLSIAGKSYVWTEEHISNRNIACRSPEFREKISLLKKGKPMSPETRKRMVEAQNLRREKERLEKDSK